MSDQTFLKTVEVSVNQREGFTYQRLISEKNVNHNILVITVSDTHPLRRVLQGTRYYFVLAGSGTFTVDGQTESVQKETLITINFNQDYWYEAASGGMKLLELNVDVDVTKGPLHLDLE